MSEYIKKEDALRKIDGIDDHDDDARANALGLAAFAVNTVPFADVVEVVHAYDKNIYPSLFECSNCGWSCNDTYGGEPCNRNGNTYDYCPNCGARIEYKVKE